MILGPLSVGIRAIFLPNFFVREVSCLVCRANSRSSSFRRTISRDGSEVGAVRADFLVRVGGTAEGVGLTTFAISCAFLAYFLLGSSL